MRFFSVFASLFFTQISLAQSVTREIKTRDSLHFEQNLKHAFDSLQELLNQDEYLNDSQKKLTIRYALDTFQIEQRFEYYVSRDFSDYGMKTAEISRQEEYEKLLNTYYQMLLSKFNDDDKEQLQTAQRYWLLYQKNEQNMNFLISMDKYSGGGTIQDLFVLSRNTEIVQQRVAELYTYLQRMCLAE